jgi:hypothetical protein
MCKKHWLGIVTVLALLVSGCGKSNNSSPASANSDATTAAPVAQDSSSDGPAAAAREFLESLRTGNEEKAAKMLSATAREKTSSLGRNVTPPASDTAKFTIGKVELVNDDGARVASTWIDIDEHGQTKSDEAIWVLRRESDGWRVAGVAAQVFPGEPPLLLNFEDPEDMFRKQQWAREEYRRRQEAAEPQPQNGVKSAEKSEEGVRR